MKKTLLSSILIFSTAFSTVFSTALPVFAEDSPTASPDEGTSDTATTLAEAFTAALSNNNTVKLSNSYNLSDVQTSTYFYLKDSTVSAENSLSTAEDESSVLVASIENNSLNIFAPFSLDGGNEASITGYVWYALTDPAVKALAGDGTEEDSDEPVEYTLSGLDFNYSSGNVILSITGTNEGYNFNKDTIYSGSQNVTVNDNTFNGGTFGMQVSVGSKNVNLTLEENVFNTYVGLGFQSGNTTNNKINSESNITSNTSIGEYAIQDYNYDSGLSESWYSTFTDYSEGETTETPEAPYGFLVPASLQINLEDINAAYTSYKETPLMLETRSEAYSWSDLEDYTIIESAKNGMAVINLDSEEEDQPDIAENTSKTLSNLIFNGAITYGSEGSFDTSGATQTVDNGEGKITFDKCYFFTEAFLENLVVTSGATTYTLTPEFSSSETEYSLDIPYSVSSVNIDPIVFTVFTITVEVGDEVLEPTNSLYNVSVSAGQSVTVTITVSYGNVLQSKEYTLTITRGSYSNNPGTGGTTTTPPTTTPDNPDDTPEEDEPGNEPDFTPDSGVNSGVTGEGPGFTEDGSQTVTYPETNTTVTYNQNTDGSKTATTQDAEGNVTSAVVTVPESAIQNNQANVSLGTNESGQTLAIPGNKVVEGTAPHITINLPENTTEAKVSVPIEEGTLDPGTVAMLVGEDGSLTPIILTTTDSDSSSITIPLTGSQRVVIMDNSLTFQDSSSMPDYAQNAAAFTSARRLMTGMGDSSPKPFDFAANTSRGQFATILYRMEGEPAVSGNVPEGIIAGAWNANAATWAVDNGLMAQGGSRFNPQDDITRDQIIAIVYRMNGSQSADLSVLDKYSDADLIPNTEFRNAMAWGVQHGIIGQGVDTLNPESDANRAEIAAMIQRIIENLY